MVVQKFLSLLSKCIYSVQEAIPMAEHSYGRLRSSSWDHPLHLQRRRWHRCRNRRGSNVNGFSLSRGRGTHCTVGMIADYRSFDGDDLFNSRRLPCFSDLRCLPFAYRCELSLLLLLQQMVSSSLFPNIGMTPLLSLPTCAVPDNVVHLSQLLFHAHVCLALPPRHSTSLRAYIESVIRLRT